MDRSRIERRLERLVRDNRVTIAITIPLVGVALLVAGSEELLPHWIAFNPYLMVLAATVMALPLIAGLAPLVDRRLAVGLIALACFAWGIELTGVHTGYPYGQFAYETDLGPMLLGDVPLALPIFYFPILLNSYLLAVLVLGRLAHKLPVRYPATLGLVVAMDLVLDPGAVALGFWAWTDPGIYYGVPAMNFLGWVLSGSVAVATLTVALEHNAVVERLQECEFFLDDLISFGLFWGLVNLYFGNAVPAALAGVLLWTLFRAEWFDFAGLDSGGRPGETQVRGDR